MARRAAANDWLKTEQIPQLSGRLFCKFSRACQFGGLTQETIDEVDEVIAAATKAIRKHYDDEQAERVEELFRREHDDASP